jgi:hypothetical protein
MAKKLALFCGANGRSWPKADLLQYSRAVSLGEKADMVRKFCMSLNDRQLILPTSCCQSDVNAP